MSRSSDSSPLPGYVLHDLNLRKDGRSFFMLLRPVLVEELTRPEEVQKALETSEYGNRNANDPSHEGDREDSDVVSEPDERAVRVPTAVEEQLLVLFAQGRGRKASEEAFIRQFEDHHAFQHNAPHAHLVLRGRELLKAFARAVAMRDRDTRNAELEQLKRLARRGAYRRVESPGLKSDRWVQAIEQLRRDHPQFREVTQYVSNCVALSTRTFGLPKMTPILLVGPPGVGKTFYAAELADALGVPVRSQSMENVQTTALLLGRRPGLLASWRQVA